MGGPAALAADGWSFACPDWVERLKEGRSLVPELPLDAVQGDRAVKIFNKLRLPDVPGQPTMGEAAGEWFRDILRAAFGSLDQVTGRRRVGEVFALVPKKNSKTTNGAGLALTALLMNERPRAELLLVGPTQEIADTAFQQVTGMIEADPVLTARFYVQEHVKAITDRRTKAKLKIKTFDMKVMTGSKPVFVLLDELHIMSASHFASRVIRQIRGGFMANPESLLVIITTQSDTPPAGAFRAELQRARGIRDGRITGANMLPVLYEFPEALQAGEVGAPAEKPKPWEDPALWPMVLPNLGRSLSIEQLIADFKTAKDTSLEDVQLWASQHLNVEIGLGLHAARWRGADIWPQRADPTLTLTALLQRSEVAVVGIDGGGLDDLLGLAVIGRERDTRRWLHWAHAWAQPIVLKLRKDIAPVLEDLQRAEQLTICKDPTQDLRELAAIVGMVNEAGLLPDKGAIGLDPNGVAAIVDAIAAVLGTDESMVPVPQGYRLTGDVWGLERKLNDGTFWHGGQALMTYAVGNAKAEQRGNAVVIEKATAGSAKIDPLMATFDAVHLMARNPERAPRMNINDFLRNPVMVL